MHPDPNQRPSTIDNLRSTSNVLGFITGAMSRTLTVFLHKDHGSHYMGLEAAAAIPIMIVFAVFWPGYDLEPLMMFLFAYLGACFYSRMRIWGAERRGEVRHSYYNGRPRLMSLFKNKDELSIKSLTEPAIALAVGFVVLLFNQPLGAYLILATFSLAITVSMSEAFEKAQTRQAIDSMIEARQHAERVRAVTSQM